MQSPFAQTLYAYYVLQEAETRAQSLQDLRDLTLASYFRIAQAQNGGKELQKLFNKRLQVLQPKPTIDNTAKSVEVLQAYLKNQDKLQWQST